MVLITRFPAYSTNAAIGLVLNSAVVLLFGRRGDRHQLLSTLTVLIVAAATGCCKLKVVPRGNFDVEILK